MQISDKAKAISPSLTLGINALSSELKAQGKDVVGFGVGEPDFDTPAYIRQAAIEAIETGKTRYTPVPGIMELRQAACERYAHKYGLRFAPAQVVVSNGAKECLYNAFQVILNSGDEVIIISPYWLTYPEQVKMAGGVPVFVQAKEENDFEPALADLEKAVSERTRAIIVNNPSNPCGNLYSRHSLEEIAGFAKAHDLYIISDEIYDELVYGKEAISIATLSEDALERTIIINGASKAYAMTGWRIGYMIAPPAVAKLASSYQGHSTSNACSISQYATLAAMRGPQEDLEKMVAIFEQRAKLIYRLINEIPGVSCRMPGGAFYVFVNVEGLYGKKYRDQKVSGSVQFSEVLLQEKLVAVVPGIAFGADGYIRLSYATSEENIEKGVSRLREFCAELE